MAAGVVDGLDGGQLVARIVRTVAILFTVSPLG
jgi:hypothetical protein